MIAYYLSIVETEEDKKRITHIYTDYYSFMCRVAAKYLREQSDIEDTVHNAMMKIIDKLDTIDFSDEKKLKSYIGVIVKHKAIDLIRADDKNTTPLEECFSVADDSLTPEEAVVSEDAYKVILERIDSLDDIYKNVCILKFVNGLKEKDIASLLDVTENVVAVRLYRARKMLKESLSAIC